MQPIKLIICEHFIQSNIGIEQNKIDIWRSISLVVHSGTKYNLPSLANGLSIRFTW